MSFNAEESTNVGWVAAPKERGTIGIIWTCLTVLILCSYRCLHFNLSPRDEVNAEWHKWHSIPYWPERLWFKKLFKKMFMVLVVIVAPELGVGMAISQFAAACESFIRVGGEPLIAMRDENVMDPMLVSEDVPQNIRNEITLAHAFYANMGGFAACNEPGSPMSGLALSEYVACLASTGPENRQQFSISETDIGNLSKSDGLTKTLAILQSTWLVVQCIARACKKLPISLLELVTAAYVLCAVAMYGFWWSKPYDIQYIKMVQTSSENPYHHLLRPCSVKPSSTDRPAPTEETFYFESGPAVDIPEFNINPMGKTVGQGSDWSSPFNFQIWDFLDFWALTPKSWIRSLLYHTVATAFAAIHIVAWNWDFPSSTVQMLWRIFSVYCTANGPVLLIYWAIVGAFDSKAPNKSIGLKPLGVIGVIGIALMGITYVVMRLGLIVLAIYSLSSMPEDVYKVLDWATVVPIFH